MVRGDVRILVGVDIDAAGSGVLNKCGDLRHATPVILSRHFKVKNLYWDIGLFSDFDGLANGVQHGVAFSSHVCRVNAAITGNYFSQLDELVVFAYPQVASSALVRPKAPCSIVDATNWRIFS